MDLVIRGGNVITAESNYTADIGVRGGVIAQIGGTMDAPREIDASGKLVIPGGVDVHVHFEPGRGPGSRLGRDGGRVLLGVGGCGYRGDHHVWEHGRTAW